MRFEFTQDEATSMPADVMAWLNAMKTVEQLPAVMKDRMVDLIMEFREKPAWFWETNRLYLDWSQRDVRLWIIPGRMPRNRTRRG